MQMSVQNWYESQVEKPHRPHDSCLPVELILVPLAWNKSIVAQLGFISVFVVALAFGKFRGCTHS
jgi:hypothetical protein